MPRIKRTDCRIDTERAVITDDDTGRALLISMRIQRLSRMPWAYRTPLERLIVAYAEARGRGVS